MYSFVPYLIDLRVASRMTMTESLLCRNTLPHRNPVNMSTILESSAAINIVRRRRRPPARTCIIIKVLCFHLR